MRLVMVRANFTQPLEKLFENAKFLNTNYEYIILRIARINTISYTRINSVTLCRNFSILFVSL